MNSFERDALTKERADIVAFAPERMEWAKAAQWYAVRVRPGSQRYPSIVGDDPEDGIRTDTCLVERNLRRAGVEHYHPTERFSAIHHRTRKVIDRRQAMFAGYCFVNMAGQNFSDVEEVDGVSSFVTVGSDGPIRFPEGLIGKLRFAEFQLEQAFRRGLAYRKAKLEAFNEMKQGRPSRSELNAFFTKGLRLQLDRTSPFGHLKNARVLSVTSRGAIRAAFDTLNGEIRADVPLAQIADVM